MAQKKATCYILNVDHSMSQYPNEAFQKAADVVSCTLADRALIGRKTDLVSVLLCGTPETDNILANDTPGQYENITVLSPFKITDIDLLRKVSNLTTNEIPKPADILDSLIVACQMIVLHCRHLKYIKQISIFTDAKHEIDWSDIDYVADTLRNNSIELTLVGVDYDQIESPDCPEVVKTNYGNWKKLIALSGVETSEDADPIVSLKEAYDQTQEIYVKEVRPTPTFRGYLYLGRPELNKSFLAISTNIYLRTKEVRLPTGVKVSSISQEGSRKVQMISRFLESVKNAETDEALETEIAKNDLLKGFKFGKTSVILSDEELASTKLKTKKEMSIIGFVDANKFPRHYLHSNALTLTAGTYRPAESTTAIATLSQALFEKNCYALVRYVSKDDSPPSIGILQPELDEKAPILQYFDVPFADDIQNYKFKSIERKAMDQEGADLIEDILDRMNLDSLGPEYLSPEENFNPITHRLNKAITTRALNEKSAIPDLDKRFSPQFELNQDIAARISGIDEEIIKHFGVEKVVDKEKEKAFDQNTAEPNPYDNTTSISDMLNAANSESRAQTDSLSLSSNKAVLTISSVTPVEDYKRVLAQEVDEDNVELANTQMREVILKLMESSFGNKQYSKIRNCLEVMRETCAKEDEASTYNTFMHEIKSWVDTTNTEAVRYELWEMLKERNLGLITNEECLDTDTRDITKVVAEKFWKDQSEEVVTSYIGNRGGNDSDDDKFDADDLEDMF